MGCRAPLRHTRFTPSQGVRAVVWGVVLAGVATFAAAVPLRPYPGQSLWLDVGVYGLVFVGVGVLLLTPADGDRTTCWGWRFLGLAVLSSAAGNVIYSLWVARGAEPAYPSVADACYLGWYPLAYLGILLLLRPSRPRVCPILAADGLVAGFAVTGLLLWLALEPVLEVSDASRAEVLVNLAYPVGDLVLILLLVAGGTIAGRGLTRGGVALGVGLAVTTIADVLYLGQDAAGTYVEGGWLDLVWLVGLAPIGGAALFGHPLPAPVPDGVARRPFSGNGLSVPLLGTVVCCVLVAASQLDRVPAAAVAVADVGILTALVRGVLTVREANGMQAAELARMHRQARTDELTGLPNRRALYEWCEGPTAQRPEGVAARGPLALLLLDLDRFKEVNDALGHAVGDELLRDVGDRVRSMLRAGDYLVRLGGDEFAVLATGTAAEGRELAQRMLSALARAFVVAGVRLHVDASAGVAAMPEHARTLGELLQCADLAMYEAKRTRRGVMVYTADPRGDGRNRLRCLEDLRGALAGEDPRHNGHLLIHLQPQFALREAPLPGAGASSRLGTGGLVGPVVGVEALVRWAHPVEGLFMPGSFLPLAKAVGLLGRLVDVVLDLALGACRSWWSVGFHIPVSINVAATDLHEPALVGQIRAALERYGLPGRALVVEVTEDSLMSDPSRARTVLERLRGNGIAVSIDDYGSGYSSLAYLRDLPVDELKLDRTFTKALAQDGSLTSREAAIVRTTADLAHSLGLRLVAEGIDDPTVVPLLVRLGVDVGQGFHLARPMPAERLLPWLWEWTRQRSTAGAS